MKKILSMVLIVLLITSIVPMNVIAEEIATDVDSVYTEPELLISGEFVEDEAKVVSSDNEYIYYTDLFYGYSHYLVNDSYLTSYSDQINWVYDSVYNGYLDSAEKYGTAIKHAFDTIVSPTDLAKLITDKIGFTDYSYNEALDAANEVFVNYYLDGLMLDNVESNFGKVQSVIAKMNKVVTVFNKLELKSESQAVDYTAEYYLQEAFDMLWDEGILSFLPESTVATLWCELNDEKFSLSSYFNYASKGIDIARSIVTCLMLEDFKIGIIDEVINTQTSDTILKQGMQRLKTKLKGNFVDIFIKSYVKDKIADKVCGEIDDIIIGAIGAGKIKLVISAINKVVFDWLWDVPEYCDVITLQVLRCYSNDLINGIRNKIATYAVGDAFVSDKILDYETLFMAYNAVNKGMIKMLNGITDTIDPYQNIYTLFSDAASAGIKNVLIKHGTSESVYSSTISEAELISVLEPMIMTTETTVVINNSIVEERIPLRAIASYCAMADGIESVRSIVESFDADQNVFEKHIESVKCAIKATPFEERIITRRDYRLDGSAVFREPSDNVQKNSIYAVGYKVLGNIYISGNIAVAFPVTVLSNVFINKSQLSVNSEMVVLGKVDISNSASLVNNGNSIFGSVYLQTMNYYAGRNSITNNGIMNIKGNFESCSDSYGNTNTGYRIIQNKNDAIMYIGGDFLANTWDVCTTITNGTVCFNGSKLQSVKNLRAYSVCIDNPYSIKYLTNSYVYGLYNTNGRELVTNGYLTYINNSTRFVEGYDYKKVQLQSNINLNQSVKGTVVANGYSINVPVGSVGKIDGDVYVSGAQVTVDGDLTVTGKVDISNSASLVNNGNSIFGSVYLQTMNYYAGRNSITNNGIMNIKGNFESCSDSYGNTNTGYRIIQNKNDAIMYIGGDFLANTWDVCTTITNGTVCFNGSKLQSVKNLRAYSVCIDNPYSIKYLTNSYVYGLYNTNGRELVTNGYLTYINNSTRFVEGYDYKKVQLQSNINLNQSVKGTVVANGYSINVPVGSVGKIDGDVYVSGAQVTVNGDLTVTGKVDISNKASLVNNGNSRLGSVFLQSMNYYAGCNSITNNATMTIVDKFESSGDRYANTRSGYRIIQSKSKAILYISGDFLANTWDVCETVTGGTFCFNGLSKQTVKNLIAQTIVIDNKSSAGVVFTTSISPSVLFNHKGNKFTLSGGGSFVDYDGDGLKDNVDNDPVTGNMCVLRFQSNNQVAGTVSESIIETPGGTKISVVAVPSSNKYQFVKWINSKGTAVSTSATYSFIAKNDDSFIAVFEKRSQPITVETSGGYIYAPSSAEVDSIVTVRTAEQNGYVYVDGSLKCNGDAIEGGYFIMPDVPVVLSATFLKNEYYFKLSEELSVAKTYVGGAYSVESMEALQEAILESEKLLTNNITEKDSCNCVEKLKAAIECLEMEYITLYYENSQGWGDINYYIWDCSVSMNWPGKPCSYLYDDIWCAVVPKDTKYIIFNDGIKQTADLLVEGDGMMARLNGNSGTNDFGNTWPSASWYSFVPVKKPSVELAFSSASLTLQDNICINFKASETLFTEVGYENPFVLFEKNGEKFTVSEYRVVDGKYVFDFTDVSPADMNDTVKATLYAEYDGTTYVSETREYSVADYCYNMLSKCNTDEYTELRTLLVDLLNYGAATQIYADRNTDNLVNASLSEDQLAWGTWNAPEYLSVMNLNHTTIENPSVKWKSGGLNLKDCIEMRFKISADGYDDLSVVAETDSYSWTIYADEFEKTAGGCYVYFDGLNAGQMSEPVYLTVYRGDTAVSNTICYSIESYAYAMQSSSDTKLTNLLEAMMKYGCSAYAYVN